MIVQGRAASCILDKFAYEIKIRVTIAASGQGRWREELEFPIDCRDSGFTPVLVVFDPTQNPKLDELVRAFAAVKGITYVGDDAWRHLEEKAGQALSHFIENYVRTPIAHVLSATEPLPPPIAMWLAEDRLTFSVDGEEVSYARKRNGIDSEDDELPDDADGEVPGV